VNCRIVVDIVLAKEDGEFVAVEVTDDNPNFPRAGSCFKTEKFIPTESGAGEFKFS